MDLKIILKYILTNVKERKARTFVMRNRQAANNMFYYYQYQEIFRHFLMLFAAGGYC